MAKISTVHVPYRGGGQLITDLISGKVDFAVATAATVLPQIEAGKLRALAVPLPQRSRLLPNTPTIAEAGPLPGYEVANWYALMGPRNLARPIVTRVNEALVESLRDPEIVAHLARHGARQAVQVLRPVQRERRQAIRDAEKHRGGGVHCHLARAVGLGDCTGHHLKSA